MRTNTPIPLDDAQRLAWLRLSRSRNVGARSFRSLVNRYGDAAKALDALPDLAARGGARAYQACSLRQAESEMARAQAAGARMLCLGAPDYPERLAEIIDPPPFLWCRGDPDLAAGSVLALIGARNASSAGLRLASTLAEDLGARGHMIASGLARGIDAAAHKAALPTGTIGVLAGGVDFIYPAENQKIADEMAETGLILSEAPMGLEPQGRHFPRRNRIVSGVARAVIVIEAAARSGSLITAKAALDQGREAMAVPGSPLDPRAEGCNDLIKHGAALIRNADDVDEALGGPRHLSLQEPEELFVHNIDVTPAPDLAARAISKLGGAPIDADILARDLAVPPATLAEALLELDLAGRIERRPGGLIALSPE